MWGIMKKFIVLFLISILTQNLSAAVPFNVDYESYDRIINESPCLPGTNDCLPGAGPEMSLKDAYDTYNAWLKTLKGQQYLEEKRERARKKAEEAERKIPECLKALPEETRKEVLGNVISGYETPPLKESSLLSISTNNSPMSRPLGLSATGVQ